MPVFSTTRFTGQIVHGEVVQPLTFDVAVDDDGVLQLLIEPVVAGDVPVSLLQLSDETGRQVAWMTLTGTAADGQAFTSDTFHVTGYSHRSNEIGLTGACAEAEITTSLAEPAATSKLWWGLRRFRSFGWLHADTDIGRVAIGGAEPDPARPQLLSATLAIQRDGVADTDWFEGAAEQLEHVARVMSFASGAYLRPYVARLVAGDRAVLRVFSRSDTTEPFYPPFVFLNLEPIFSLACAADTTARAAFAQLDPAVRWLLTPGYYDEIRLMAAMTALENLVDQAFPGDAALFVKPSLFKKAASAVRAMIAERKLPEGMKAKVPELNRRTFVEKLDAYVAARQVVVSDLPAQMLRDMINARNTVVHTGVYFDPEIQNQPDLWDHLLLARELVTRLLLAELGFIGNYFSPFYGPNRQLRFPSCRPLTDAQGVEIPEDSPPSAADVADQAPEGAGDGT